MADDTTPEKSTDSSFRRTALFRYPRQAEEAEETRYHRNEPEAAKHYQNTKVPVVIHRDGEHTHGRAGEPEALQIQHGLTDISEGIESVLEGSYRQGSRPAETDQTFDSASAVSIDEAPSITFGTTLSSTTSQVQAETTEAFVQLLLDDDEVRTRMATGFEKMPAKRLERNCQRLLRRLAHDLREEATDASKLAVVAFISRRAGIVSQKLLSAVDPARAEKMKQMKATLQQEEERDVTIQRYLEDLEVREPIHHTKAAEIDFESDGSEEHDQESLPKIDQLKEFIKNSKAFEKFRLKLRVFTSPEVALKGLALDTRYKLLLEELARNDQVHDKPPDPFTPYVELGQSNLEAAIIALLRPIQHFIPPFTARMIADKLHSMFRPRLPEGYTRITWTCGCGKSMFADVQETYLGGGRDFEQQIRRAASEALGSRYSLPSVRSTSSTSQGSSASNTTSYVGSSSNQGSSAAARTRDTSPNISFQDAGGRTSGLFVLLCVNGPQIAQLGQISVSRGQNDQILFQNIRASYKELRHRFKRNFHPDTPELLQTIVLWGDRLWNQSQKQAISIFSYLRLNWLVWWIGDSVFYVPQSANFVRFELIPVKTDVAPEILESRCLPPEIEVRKQKYLYSPCSADIHNPVLRYPYLHSLFESGNHLDGFWTDRTPKKMGSILEYHFAERPVIGWGVNIIEGPNWYALMVLATLFVFMTFLLAMIYSLARGDVSSGFTMGSFLLAGGTLLITLVVTMVIHGTSQEARG